MNEIEQQDVEVGAWTLRTYSAGQVGDPVVLWLHGSGPGAGALSNWQGQLDSMTGYRHIAPDLLGFGDSTHPPDLPLGVAASAQARAQAALDLLDALDVPVTHVVGNSMGGMIALLMLAAAPRRFDRVVLMGSAGAPITPTPDLVTMIRYYDDPSPEAMADLLGRFMYDTSRYGDRLGGIAADRAAVAAREDIRQSHLRTFSPEGTPLVFSEEALATIDHEVLAVHGREDRIIPVESSIYLSRHLPRAQLHVLPHAGHWLQIEQPERFQALLTLFLDDPNGDPRA
ncbi:MAG: alpha/beta hydrolase [Candidatus Nanopelagicales bacterium]